MIERLRVTPASRFALLLGTVLRDIVMFAVPGVVVIAVGVAFGYHPHWGGLAVLLVLLALLTAACSATRPAPRAEPQADRVPRRGRHRGATAADTARRGSCCRSRSGPTWLRVLGHFNPMYYAVQAARSLAAGTVATGTVGLGFLVMAVIAALAGWWGTRAYQRAMA